MLSVSATSAAQELPGPQPRANEDTLARDVLNPIGKLSSVPIQNESEFGIGPWSRVRNTLSLSPTLGFSLTERWGIVSRTRVPIIWQPDPASEYASSVGLGDAAESLFLVRVVAARVLVGAGPTVLLPTANAPELGAGKVALGPTFALIVRPKQWTVGAVAAQVWSVTGASDRQDVSVLAVKYLVAFQLPRGSYIQTAPNVTANWNAPSSRDVWTVPVGGSVGKVFGAGGTPVDVSVGAYWNAIRPTTPAAATATAQVQIALLLP
jgi:hypothetical protein